jgi:hypothetical protein
VYVAADETLDAAAWGVARTALPDTDLPFQTDLTSQLHLTMVSGSLASVSSLEMLNGANLAALIRADGNAELIQFQDAVLDEVGIRIVILTDPTPNVGAKLVKTVYRVKLQARSR